ncbi:MAG: putative zinc-binding metallopeptidase, partial [Steroidobacteraceae bacterium]
RRLERQMMREVEGGNANWQIRILRHEAGHAIDTAFRLRRRRSYTTVFGPPSEPYPERYRARPASRRYVHHLGDWYAQSHPTEDFAETFAVWLKPNSDWRRTYENWPARNKLEFMDTLMRELRGRAPPVRSRRRIETLDRNTRTLREHYAEKLARLARHRSSRADGVLQQVFTARPKRRVAARASSLLRAVKPQLVDSVAKSAGVDRYSVYQVLRRATVRAEQLKLRVRGSRREALKKSRRMIAKLVRLYGEGSGQQLLL